ncbi:MAG: protein kinase [Actinomycetota bacterium]
MSNLGIEGLEDIQQIGAGGSSRVYRARQVDLDRIVAVKVLNPGHDQNVAKRFDRERKAMGRLSLHEGIVPVYSTGLTAHNEPYLVMPFYANGSLQDQIDAGALEWETAVSYVDVAAETIAEAHDEGVVHLDLKPANILLTNGGAPRIADFGIAKLTSGQGASAGTTQGAAFTPAYSAPETFLDGETGPPSDVYGLGATLWALLVGHPPFLTPGDDTNLMAVIGRVVNNPVGDLRHFTPGPICDVIERAMAKRPEQRYQTAREFSLALKSAAAAVSPEFRQQPEPKGTAFFPPPAAPAAGSASEQTHVQTRIDAVDLPRSIAVGAAPAPPQKPLLQQEADQTSVAVGAAPPLQGTPFLDIDRFRFGPILIGVLAFLGVIGLAYFGLNRSSSTAADQDVAVTVTVPAGPAVSEDGEATDQDPTGLAGDGSVVSPTTAEEPTTTTTEAPDTTAAATPTTAAEVTTTTEDDGDATTTTEDEDATTTVDDDSTTTTEDDSTTTVETTTTTEETTTTTEETTTTTEAPDPVGAPTGLAASVSGDEVSLSWSAPSSGPAPTSYRVYRNGGTAPIGTSSTTSFTDSGLDPGNYTYVVRSADGDGETSDPSNTASATVEQEQSNPDPTSVTASGVASANSVSVTLNADNCFTSYRISAIPTGNNIQPLPVIVNGAPCETTASNSITGLESGAEYTVTVVAWSSTFANGAGDSFVVTTPNS